MSFFILTDVNKHTLKIEGNKKLVKQAQKSLITLGLNFEETNCGTNAINLSMMLNRIFYTLPEQHFCEFLQDWYIFSIPIIINTKIEGSLSLISKENCINQEYASIIKLMAYKISNEIVKRKNEHISILGSNISITKRQLEILKLLAKGNTDMSIALELGIKIGTVRFHKTNIFKAFNAESSIQVIVKALKLGIISLKDIEI